jgi:hypothetical protein
MGNPPVRFDERGWETSDANRPGKHRTFLDSYMYQSATIQFSTMPLVLIGIGPF